MLIRRGIGEPLRVYGFVGIYITYMLLMVAFTVILAAILNLLGAPVTVLVGVPIFFLFVGTFYIKNIQKKFGHKGRFIIRAAKISRIRVKRNNANFFNTIVSQD